MFYIVLFVTVLVFIGKVAIQYFFGPPLTTIEVLGALLGIAALTITGRFSLQSIRSALNR